MSSIIHRSEFDISHSARMKKYPDGSWEILACDRPVFREDGWEMADRPDSADSISKSDHTRGTDNMARASRRARGMVRDYARSNEWDFFVTLTLDATKIDRYCPSDVIKKLNVWADNQVRRHGLRYILVPELHKDGALHFHGLFGGGGLTAIDSGTFTKNGWKHPRKPKSCGQAVEWLQEPDTYHPVFNLPQWTLGFTTAIPLYGDRKKAIEYVCKYVGKGRDKIAGRWYYSGGDLHLPAITYVPLNLSDLLDTFGSEVYTFRVEEAGASFGIVRGEGDMYDRQGITGTEQPD